MYLRGLSDAMTDADMFGSSNPFGVDLSTGDLSNVFEANYSESPSNYSLPNIAPSSAGAASGGSPSWTSLLQTTLNTYAQTKNAQAAQAVAQSRTAAASQPLYRYPSSYPAGYSPFPAGSTGSGPLGLSTGSLIALAGLGLGVVALMGK